MAASPHGDTPYSGKTVTSVPVTPYTTSVDVNVRNPAGTAAKYSNSHSHSHERVPTPCASWMAFNRPAPPLVRDEEAAFGVAAITAGLVGAP